MWIHLWSVLGLTALCAGWVLFQRWIERTDPDGNRIEAAGKCDSGCSRTCDEH